MKQPIDVPFFTSNIAVPGLVSFVNVKEGAVNCNDFHSVNGGTLKINKA